MKTGKKVLSVFLAVLMLCAAVIPAVAEQGGGENSAAETKASRVAAKSIKISGSKFVAKGKEITLRAAVSPAKASQEVVWKSSDKKTATVSDKGVVKGIKAGKVKITATSKSNPKVKATWQMTVTPKPVKKITLQAKTKKLDLSGTTQVTLDLKISPSDAAQQVIWRSSKPAVATVTSKGKVTAKSRGKTEITAAAVDGSGVKAKITITVIDSSIPENPKPHVVYVTAHEGNTFTFFMYYPELKSSYALNNPEDSIYAVDFRLGFSVKDGKNRYTVETWHYKDSKKPRKLSVARMHHTLYYVNQELQEFDEIGKAKFTVNGKNLKWTVTFPDGFNPSRAKLTGSFFNYKQDYLTWNFNKPLLP